MFKRFVNPDSNDVGSYERRPRGSRKTDDTESSVTHENNKSLEASKNSTNPHLINDNHLEKPCKACVDFKDWLKHSSTKSTAESEAAVVQQISINSECPLMRDDLGRASWSLLHTMAAYYSQEPKQEEKQSMNEFINSFSKLFPCPECRIDFQDEIAKSPPDLSNRLTLSTWMCQQHNIVNKKLGKPEFDCKRVLQRWKDGPPDGSCD